MFGTINPKIPATRSSDSSLLWSAKGLSVNLANAFAWTAAHSWASNATFASTVSLNGTTYNNNYFQNSNNWSNYSAMYNYASFYQNNAMYWGAGGDQGVFYIGSSNSVTRDSSTFVWDYTRKRLGVGVATGTQDAAAHFRTAVGDQLNQLTSLSATLTQFVLLGAPNGSSVTQVTGHLYAPTSPGTTINAAATSYLAGDIIDYRIYQYTAGPTFSVVFASTQGTITTGTGAADGDSVTVAWTANNTGTASNDGCYVVRQVNGGGYNDYIDVGNVVTFLDDNTGWSATPVVTPTYPDFIATGATRNYSGYTIGSTPVATVVYSGTSENIAFTDDSSGNPYVIQHYWLGANSLDVRVLNTDLSTYADFTYATYYEEDTTGTPFASGSTVIPTTYGYLSDGTALNRDYDFYNYGLVNGVNIYSLSSGIAGVTDPNDGNYYYVVIQFGSVSTSAKLLIDYNGAMAYSDSIVGASSPIYDDGITSITGDITVMPNQAYPACGLFESYGTSSIDPPTIISRSLDGTYSRFEFQNLLSAALASLSHNGTTVSLSALGDGNLAYTTTPRVSWDATGLGFFNTAPIAQPTTGGAAATFAANTSAIVDDSATFDGYTIGQVVSALRSLGILL
jgi:hypothetical protein